MSLEDKRSTSKVSGLDSRNDIQVLGSRVPYALRIERAVLGAVLLEQGVLQEHVDELRVALFYVVAHKRICEAIRALFAKSVHIDLITVSDYLKKQGQLESVGGVSYLADLTQDISSAAHLESHLRILTELGIKRSLIEMASVAQKSSYDSKSDAFDVLDNTERSVFEISSLLLRKGFRSLGDAVQSVYKDIEDRRVRKKTLVGIPSCFYDLDSIIQSKTKHCRSIR